MWLNVFLVILSLQKSLKSADWGVWESAPAAGERKLLLSTLGVGDRSLTPTTSCKRRAPPESGREFWHESPKQQQISTNPLGLSCPALVLPVHVLPSSSTNAVSFTGITLTWLIIFNWTLFGVDALWGHSHNTPYFPPLSHIFMCYCSWCSFPLPPLHCCLDGKVCACFISWIPSGWPWASPIREP